MKVFYREAEYFQCVVEACSPMKKKLQFEKGHLLAFQNNTYYLKARQWRRISRTALSKKPATTRWISSSSTLLQPTRFFIEDLTFLPSNPSKVKSVDKNDSPLNLLLVLKFVPRSKKISTTSKL